MRIVITGATGNVGTALLTALDTGDEVVGLARRLPDATAEPYRRATWRALDVGAPGADRELTRIFVGADVVVHLAWAISPASTDPPMARTNEQGTAHVLAAAAAAGVSRLIVASSVAAYGPAPRWEKVTEDWPRDGIAGSAYSRGKADLESMLDRFEADHGDIRVARVRPCAIMHPHAAGEFTRWMLGPLVPAGLVGARWLPVPLWNGLRAQAVHSADVAEAIRLIIDTGFDGPVNLAAPGVLDANTLAAVLGRVRIPVPKPLVRIGAGLAWQLGALPLHPGWVELADLAALVDTGVAERELGWRPRHDAVGALAGLVTGLRAGDGAASGPLAPSRPGGVWSRLRSLVPAGPSHQSQS